MEGFCALLQAAIAQAPDDAKAAQLREMYEQCQAEEPKPKPGDTIMRPMTGDNGTRPQ
jgi:hypothetical protein